MSTIALKIGALLVRTLAKPIANSIKTRAKVHGPFRQTCIAVAQVLHSSDVTLRMRLLGEQGAKVRPLNDTKAIDMGANFLSESFLFAVAAGVVIFESVRASRKANTRHENVTDDIADLQEQVAQLRAVVARIAPQESSSLGIVDYGTTTTMAAATGDAAKSDAVTTTTPTAAAAAGTDTKMNTAFAGLKEDPSHNFVIIPAHKPVDPNAVATKQDISKRPESASSMTSSMVGSISDSFTSVMSKLSSLIR
ncbi:optic atrophy 3 protein-domain-containing protein [Limtongia smithiae]|uniref:optic atrophy 3 protein-domain-containing protein n=1 Tax=Limtongia smithiae TaxID=1125753 RepID=UPI0034CDCB5C